MNDEWRMTNDDKPWLTTFLTILISCEEDQDQNQSNSYEDNNEGNIDTSC